LPWRSDFQNERTIRYEEAVFCNIEPTIADWSDLAMCRVAEGSTLCLGQFVARQVRQSQSLDCKYKQTVSRRIKQMADTESLFNLLQAQHKHNTSFAPLPPGMDEHNLYQVRCLHVYSMIAIVCCKILMQES
jgi:hypothetical protein